MIRLYIENQEMDVTEGFSHQITYAVDDLNNLDSKSTSFSKTIVLPGTAKNNYLLGNIFEFGNSNFTGEGENVGYNFNASKSAKCRLDSDGLTIIKGVLRLMEIIRDEDSIEYEIAIFGELGGFFSKLQNKKLEDLDFSQYKHQYNINNIVDTWQDANNFIFITDDQTSLVNSTESFCDIYGVDYREYIDGGDTIKFENYFTSSNYGTYTVNRIEWDGTKSTIYITTSFVSPPGSSFTAKITLLGKKGFGYYYPLIDYGNYSSNKKDYIIRTFRPAFHVYEYIDKIIKGAGYTWESKFFKTDFFKRLIIPNKDKDLYKKSSTKYITNTSATLKTLYSNDPMGGTTGNQLLGGLSLSNFTYNSTTGVFTYTGSSTIEIKASANLYYTHSNFQGTAKIAIVKNDYDIIAEVNCIVTSIYQNAIFNGNITLNTNDTIKLKLQVNNNPRNGVSTLTVDDRTLLVVEPASPGYIQYSYNDMLDVNDLIPQNVLQKDFFASILKIFYLMVTEDKYKDKHLKIEPFTWFYDLNSSSYLDWSMKLDRSQPIRIKPMSEANARYYDIKFKGDNDYYNELYKKKYNEGYGDVRFDNELEFSKDAETTEVIFSSTPLLGYVGKDKITPAIFKWDGKVIGTNEENIPSIIRIMQKKIINDVTSWNVKNDTGTVDLGAFTQYPYAGHFDDPDAPGSDLNFGATKELFFSLSAGALGNNLFNTFYSSYLAEITDKDSRLVTAKFKLNDTDIFNLDFSKFIWLDGVLYRLSKVIDYTPGEICTVELLRVIYTTYDNSVNASDVPEIYINGVTWQTKNYEGEYYRNGDPIPQITDAAEWQDTTDGAWCYYRNETPYGVEYGKLYNWFALHDPRGFAPLGYHVPDNDEWTSLFATNSNAYAWKEEGTTHWNTANGTDLYGFTGLGGGEREIDGTFSNIKIKARFWTYDQYDTDLAYARGINNASATLFSDKIDKNYGFSVRLVRDL